MSESAGNAVTRGFNRAVDLVVAYYGRTLEWVLEHESLTLIVTIATLVATVVLYIIIPKGFLPLQDTGLIYAVMEGGEEVSFTEMQRLRAQVETAIRRDPDVSGIVSVVGVTPINASPNSARLGDHAALARRAQGERDDGDRAVAAPGRADPRRHRLLPAGPGHPDFDAGEPRPVPVHAHRNRRERREPVGRSPRRAAAVLAGAARCRLRSAGPGPAHEHHDQPRGRRPPRRFAADHQRHAQRRLRPAPDFDDLRAVEPVSRYPRGDAGLSERPGLAQQALCPRHRRRPVPLSAVARFDPATAPLVVAHQEQFPAVTLSFNLAPDAALGGAVEAITTAERQIGMPTSVGGSYWAMRPNSPDRSRASRGSCLRRRSPSTSCSASCTRASFIRSPSCRSEIKDTLANVNTGYKTFYYSDLISLIDRINMIDKNRNYEYFIVSDFRKPNFLKADNLQSLNIKNSQLYLINSAYYPAYNISLDEVVLKSKIISSESNIRVSVKVTNHSLYSVYNKVIRLYADEKLEQETAIDFIKSESKNVEFIFKPPKVGLTKYRFELNRDDISQDALEKDNSFYASNQCS